LDYWQRRTQRRWRDAAWVLPIGFTLGAAVAAALQSVANPLVTTPAAVLVCAAVAYRARMVIRSPRRTPVARMDFAPPGEAEIYRIATEILAGVRAQPEFVHVAPPAPEVGALVGLLRANGSAELIGDSGSGKSTAAYHVAQALWREGAACLVVAVGEVTGGGSGRVDVDTLLEHLDLVGPQLDLVVIEDAQLAENYDELKAALEGEASVGRGMYLWIRTSSILEPESPGSCEVVLLDFAEFKSSLVEGFYKSKDLAVQRALEDSGVALATVDAALASQWLGDPWQLAMIATGRERSVEDVLERVDELGAFILSIVALVSVAEGGSHVRLASLVEMCEATATPWLRELSKGGGFASHIESLGAIGRGTAASVRIRAGGRHRDKRVELLHPKMGRLLLRRLAARQWSFDLTECAKSVSRHVRMDAQTVVQIAVHLEAGAFEFASYAMRAAAPATPHEVRQLRRALASSREVSLPTYGGLSAAVDVKQIAGVLRREPDALTRELPGLLNVLEASCRVQLETEVRDLAPDMAERLTEMARDGRIGSITWFLTAISPTFRADIESRLPADVFCAALNEIIYSSPTLGGFAELVSALRSTTRRQVLGCLDVDALALRVRDRETALRLGFDLTGMLTALGSEQGSRLIAELDVESWVASIAERTEHGDGSVQQEINDAQAIMSATDRVMDAATVGALAVRLQRLPDRQLSQVAHALRAMNRDSGRMLQEALDLEALAATINGVGPGPSAPSSIGQMLLALDDDIRERVSSRIDPEVLTRLIDQSSPNRTQLHGIHELLVALPSDLRREVLAKADVPRLCDTLLVELSHAGGNCAAAAAVVWTLPSEMRDLIASRLEDSDVTSRVIHACRVQDPRELSYAADLLGVLPPSKRQIVLDDMDCQTFTVLLERALSDKAIVDIVEPVVEIIECLDSAARHQVFAETPKLSEAVQAKIDAWPGREVGLSRLARLVSLDSGSRTHFVWKTGRLISLCEIRHPRREMTIANVLASMSAQDRRHVVSRLGHDEFIAMIEHDRPGHTQRASDGISLAAATGWDGKDVGGLWSATESRCQELGLRGPTVWTARVLLLLDPEDREAIERQLLATAKIARVVD